MVLAASTTTTTTDSNTIRNGGNGPSSASNNKSINNHHHHGNNSGSNQISEASHSSDDEKSTASYESNNRKPNNNGHSGNMKSVKNKTGEYEAEKIRVGRDYQVICPELIPEKDRNPEGLPEKALLVWSPTKDIPEKELEKYITVAKEKYGYNGEQALGMLFWHKHDLERAIMDLANFTPFPDEWTVEDKVLFEQAFQFHGKSFNRIRQMLPDKSIASLVKYYYSWKKNRARPNILDRPERNKNNKGSSENGSEEPGSNDASDLEEKITLEDDQTPRSSPPLQESNHQSSATLVTQDNSENDTKTETITNNTTTTTNSKPEIEITQINNNKRSSPSHNLSDEITIVPIARERHHSSDKNTVDGPPPAKQLKLDTSSSPAPATVTSGGP